jgi:hypothetical protein
MEQRLLQLILLSHWRNVRGATASIACSLNQSRPVRHGRVTFNPLNFIEHCDVRSACEPLVALQ